MCRGSVVGIETDYGLLSNGYRGIFPPRVKRQEREADHSTPTSAEVKKMLIYTSTPQYVFMA
jgi:hypothetical protein